MTPYFVVSAGSLNSCQIQHVLSLEVINESSINQNLLVHPGFSTWAPDASSLSPFQAGLPPLLDFFFGTKGSAETRCTAVHVCNESCSLFTLAARRIVSASSAGDSLLRAAGQPQAASVRVSATSEKTPADRRRSTKTADRSGRSCRVRRESGVSAEALTPGNTARQHGR